MPKRARAKTVLARRRVLLRAILLAYLLLVGSYAVLGNSSNSAQKESSNGAGQYSFRQDAIGRVGEGFFNFEIANTPQSRSTGLSGREGLAPTNALVFVFDEPDEYCFWMKDMKFAIDILWFDEDYSMVHKQLNATPESYPQSFCPPKPAKYVVEVAAGVTELNQITTESKLQIDY